MNVTVDSFRMTKGGGSTLGFADVTFDGAMKIKDIRLMSGANGMFAAMPSRKENDGKYHEIVHINLVQLKDQLTDALINAYNMESQGVPQQWR